MVFGAPGHHVQLPAALVLCKEPDHVALHSVGQYTDYHVLLLSVLVRVYLHLIF